MRKLKEEQYERNQIKKTQKTAIKRKIKEKER